MIPAPVIGLDNPYPGLRPFEEEDAPLFFGRGDQTYDLLRRLDEHRFVAVLGLSGSGKSSLVRAGLIPALRRGYVAEGSGRWRIAKMRPGADPMLQLSEALDKALGPRTNGLETLRRSSFGLIRAAREACSPDENLLILVDQFEEIFRQPRQASSDFVSLLLTAVQEAPRDHRIYIVLTMRTDYLGDCAQFRDLPEALNDSQYLVPRLTPDQRRAAIEEPAKRLDGEVDAHLLQQLLIDAGDDPDQLPILQHLLMRMWDLSDPAQTPRRITVDEYNRAGGWKGAIDQHGAELMKPLSDSRKRVARRIFQRVTELGGRERDRRRLTRLSELIAVAAPFGDEADLRALIEHFSGAKSNFLTSPDWTTDPDPLVDITHESLIRQWSELNAWAREEHESGEWCKRIEDRVRTKGAFLAGAELESALKASRNSPWTDSWANRYLSDFEPKVGFKEVLDFLQSSKKRQSDEIARLRRTRTLIASAAVVFAFLAVTAGYFWWTARVKQHESRARELAAYAVESLTDDPERSVALGIQAVKATLAHNEPPVPAAVSTLHRAIVSSNGRLTLRGHTDSVNSVAFSPDGKRLATASSDQTAKVWDTATGQELLTLRGHTKSVEGVAFSPDGRRLATASWEGTAKVWDAATGRELLTLRGHTGAVVGVAFSPDGKRLATASSDQTAKVWDAATGRELLTLRGHTKSVEGVAFSPDGKRLATASWEGTAKVWDTATGRELLTLRGHTSSLHGVAFSPDGNRLATASWDQTAKVWDAASGQELLTLRGHTNSVQGVAFSPDGKRLATASWDQTARVWDAATGQELLTLRGHTNSASGVAFSPNGKRLATASWDRTAKVWDAATDQELLALRGHMDFVVGVAFSPDGKRLATASIDGTAKVWDAASGQELLTLRGHTAYVDGVAFSPDGKRLATASFDRTAKVWDAATGRELLTLRGHTDPVYGVAFSADGKRLATASEDQTTKLWDAASDKELLTLRGHTNSVFGVAFSPDGKRLATASFDQTAKVWDAATGQELLTLRGHTNSIYGVAFSPDGKRLATASWDQTAKVWDAASGKELLTLRGHTASVDGVAFTPNGKRLATASEDQTAKIWDAATGQELLTLRGHTASVVSVAFSPEGKRLATASEDGTVQIWAIDINDLLALAKTRVSRPLTTEECNRYFPQEPCPVWPDTRTNSPNSFSSALEALTSSWRR